MESVAEKVVEEEGVWAVEEDGRDWFEEVVEAIGVEGKEGAMIEDLGDMSGEAFVVAETVKSSGVAELYDSRYTNHIFSYCDWFENFEHMSLQSFKATNKQTFSTIGKEELVIDIPNGLHPTKM